MQLLVRHAVRWSAFTALRRWQPQVHFGSGCSAWAAGRLGVKTTTHMMASASNVLEQKLLRKLDAARSHRDSCTDPTRRAKIAAGVEALEVRLQQLGAKHEAVQPAESKRPAKPSNDLRSVKRQRRPHDSKNSESRLAAGAALGDGHGLSLGERIARAALLAFDSLPTRGKPQHHEWTVLAAFVAVHPKDDRNGSSRNSDTGSDDSSEKLLEVLSIGTGSKCVGMNRMSAYGDRLHDSHAEIIARRALRRYILAEYAALLRNDSQQAVLLERQPENGAIRYRKGVELALYINQPPCGDASIFDTGASASLSRRGNEPATSDRAGGQKKRSALPTFVKQTGAKPVGPGTADPQEVGVLRTKSGRSDLRAEDRSISMSCSDKIAKWNVLGVGGALLSILLPRQALYISHLVVGHQSQQPQGPVLEALRRAVVDRANEVILDERQPESVDDRDQLDTVRPDCNGDLTTLVYSTPVQRAACPGARELELHLSTACRFAAARPDPSSETDLAGNSSTGLRATSDRRQSSCGFSVAWHKTVDINASSSDAPSSQCEEAHEDIDWVSRAPGLHEVTIGATGLRQGAKVVSRSDDDGPVMQSMQSSLCKRQMVQIVRQTLQTMQMSRVVGAESADGSREFDPDQINTLTKASALMSGDGADCTSWMNEYDAVKGCATPYQRASLLFRAADPFRGWLRSQDVAKPPDCVDGCQL